MWSTSRMMCAMRDPRTISLIRERRDWPRTMYVMRCSWANRRISSATASPSTSTLFAAQLLGELEQLLDLPPAADLGVRAHVQHPEAPLEALREPVASADELGGHAVGPDADQDALLGGPGVQRLLSLRDALEELVDLLGGLAQGQLAQRDQVLALEEVGQRAGDLVEVVDDAAPQAVEQRGGREVHEHDLVGRVEHGVRDGLLHADAGDLVHGVVQALDVLDVDGGDDVDAGGQDLVDALPALLVPRAGDVGVRQLVDQHPLRPARDHRVGVELRRTPCRGRSRRLSGTCSRPSTSSAVSLRPCGLDEADDDVLAARAAPVRLGRACVKVLPTPGA